MCDVTTALMVGATALGSGLQIMGQDQAHRAQAEVARQTAQAQRGFRNTAIDSAMRGTEVASRPAVEDGIERNRQSRVAAYAPAIAPQSGYLPGQSAGPQIVRDAIDRTRTEVAGDVGQRAGALARLGGWSDALYGVSRDIRRTGEEAPVQASFARGVGGLLPLRTAAAGYRGSMLRTAGDLVTGAGLLGGPYVERGWRSLFAPAIQPERLTGRFPGPV